ncbi:MAG: ParB N-terminal domain-containing protein [Planctomycetota bacterium]
MARKAKRPDYAAAAAAGASNTARRRDLESVAAAKVVAATMKLDQVEARAHGNARALDPNHVYELAVSIAATGLIQPIAVDRVGRLVAGGHRLAAVLLLSKTPAEREAFAAALEEEAGKIGDGDLWAAAYEAKRGANAIAVFRIDFNSKTDADRALAIEVAENEKRRDFTAAEVKKLADRLRGFGYRDKGGRPKRGERALTPALAAIVGKSRRTVIRYLAPDSKTVTSVTVSEAAKIDPDKALRRARAAADALVEALKGARGARKEAKEAALDLSSAINRALGEDEE